LEKNGNEMTKPLHLYIRKSQTGVKTHCGQDCLPQWVLSSEKQTHFPAKITYRERIRSRKIVEKLVESEKEGGSSA